MKIKFSQRQIEDAISLTTAILIYKFYSVEVAFAFLYFKIVYSEDIHVIVSEWRRRNDNNNVLEK